MELALNILLIIVGFALLIKGADWFVDGSAGIAAKCKISPLVIGLTIVAFGTSLPEFAVSVASAAEKSADLAIGNVVGSNITNILLILGFSAAIHVLPVQKNSVCLDIPVLLLASVLLIGLGLLGGALEWWDGLIMVCVFVFYMAALFVRARKSAELPQPVIEEGETKKPPRTKFGAWLERAEEKVWFLILLTVVGGGMIVGGGTLLVNSAKFIAGHFGVSERIIGLTVVAIGTSLPELVTSVVAAAKGETDIAVGNVIGSNIFNILMVAGFSALICPLPFSLEGNLFDALFALSAALLLYLIVLVRKGRGIGRAGGLFLLAAFVCYYVLLFIL